MTTLPQNNPLRLPRPSAPAAPIVASPVNPGIGGVGGGGFSGGSVGGAGLTPDDILRVIRSNLWLIGSILCASLILGYVVNQLLARYIPRYSSSGMISIHAPAVYNYQTRTLEPLSDFNGLSVEQRTQATLLRSDSLFTKVLTERSSTIRDTAWFHGFEVQVRQPDGTTKNSFDLAAAKRSLDENFAAAPVDTTNLVTVTMTCANGSDAREIVYSIIDEHLREQDRLIADREFEKSDTLNKIRDSQKTRLKELLDKIHAKALDLNIEGTGRSELLGTRRLELDKLMNTRFDLQNALTFAKTRLDAFMTQINNGLDPDQVTAAINADPDVRLYKSQIDDLELKIATNYQSGTESNSKRDDDVRMAAVRSKLDEARALARTNSRNAISNDLQSQVSNETQELASLDKRIETSRNELSSLSNTMNDYTSLSDELNKAREEAAQTQQQVDALASMLQQMSHGVTWANKPIVPDSPSFPKIQYTMGVAVMIGLMAALGIAFLRELTDTTVRSPRDITRVGNLTLLGMIPHEDDDLQSHGVPLPFVIYQAPTSIMAEGFRQVRTRLQHAASLDTTRTILVTSPSPGDGKSVVAANLAAGLALNGRNILLVDCNFRRPILDKSFSVDNTVGFSDVLSGGVDRFENAVHRTVVPNLDVMPSGSRPANATELLESQILLDFIDRALEEYDHVIFDTGPMLLVSETAALAPRVDGVVTVVRARTNTRGLLMRLRDNLRQLKAEHLGVVLNAVRSQGGGYYGRNIKTYYEYQNPT